MNLDDSRFLYFLREEAAPALEICADEDNSILTNNAPSIPEPHDSFKPEQSQSLSSSSPKTKSTSQSKKKKKKKKNIKAADELKIDDITIKTNELKISNAMKWPTTKESYETQNNEFRYSYATVGTKAKNIDKEKSEIEEKKKHSKILPISVEAELIPTSILEQSSDDEIKTTIPMVHRSPPGFGLEDFDLNISTFIEVSMSKNEIDKKKEDIEKGLYNLYEKIDFDLVVVYPGCHTLPDMLKKNIGQTPRIIICNLEREDGPIRITEENAREMFPVAMTDSLTIENFRDLNKAILSEIVKNMIPTLKSFSLTNFEYEDNNTFLMLDSLTQVKTLTLAKSDSVRDDDIYYVATYMTQLQHLVIKELPNISDISLEKIAECMVNLKSLKVLDIPYLSFKDMLNFMNVKRLESLDITGSLGITDDAMENIGHLPALKHLKMTYKTFHSDGFTRMAYILGMRGLESLSLEIESFNAIEIVLEGISNLKRLENLHIKNGNLKTTCIKKLLKWYMINKMKSIKLEPTVNIVHTKTINSLSVLNQLTELCISKSTNICDETIYNIISKLKLLRLLHIRESGIEDNSIAYIANLEYLEDLDIGGCHRLSNLALEKLPECKSLMRLTIDRMASITDAGLMYLAGCKTLTYIDISECPDITVDGIEAITCAPNLKNIKALRCEQLEENYGICKRKLKAKAVRMVFSRIDPFS